MPFKCYGANRRNCYDSRLHLNIPMTDMVEGGDWISLWEAVKEPNPFTVCFDDFCYDVPGWGSPYLLALGVIEIIWWLFVSAWVGRKLKRVLLRHKAKREPHDKADGFDNDPY